jgi:hypothetical protein
VQQVSTPAAPPPSGFGYPLGVFSSLNPSEFYFTLTALMGFPLRSFLFSKVVAASLQQSAHLLFLLPLISEIAFLDGRAIRSSWASTLQVEFCSAAKHKTRLKQPTPLGFPFLRFTADQS